ncbi:MAG: glycosyltransferase family 4 protein [Sodaliphilus sp.]
MVIGYDAKYMFEHVGGLSHYASLSLEALTQCYPQNHYIIYTSHFKNNGMSVNKLLVQPSVHRKSYHCKSLLDRIWPSRMVYRSCKKHGVQVFHGMFGTLPKGIQRSGMASVITLGTQLHHHYPKHYSFFRRHRINSRLRHDLKHADAVVVMSEFSKSEICRLYGVPQHKVRVIMPVCEDYYSADVSEQMLEAQRVANNLPEKFILATGNFDSRHNLEKVVEALPLLAQHDIHLVVVGHKNEYFAHIMHLAESLGVKDRIVRIKTINPIAMPAVYRLASAVCVPSRYECASLSILRSFETGVPVVAATGSCMEEFGADAALYFHPDSAQELAQALDQALGSACQSLLVAAQKQKQKFTFERLAHELETLYREVRANKLGK